ncbi:MAG TPA: glycosyltransferase family 4 protein [Actinomycetota bacterium]
MPDGDDRRLRVLHVVTRLNVGGPARHVAALTEGLRRGGDETLIAAGTTEPEESELAIGPDQPLVRIAPLRRPLDPGADLRAVTELTRLVRRFQPDVVHTHMAKAGALGRSAARRAGVPTIVHTFHGHVLEGYFASPSNAAFTFAERRLARHTNALVAVSNATRDDLVALGIGRPDQWHVMPLALDLGPLLEGVVDRDEARGWLDLPADAPIVGIAGRLVPIKNHVLFVEAARRIARVRPDAVFAVAGDGELRGMLEAEAREALGDRIRFLGWVADLARLYAAIDVVVLTSLSEGTPVALIEAAAAGKPVVATDVGGVAEVVLDGRTGILVPSGDAEAIALGVLSILEDDEMRTGMGQAGRAVAAERHSPEVAAAEMHALYEGRPPR